MADLHNYARRVQTRLDWINGLAKESDGRQKPPPDISERNKELLLKFVTGCQSEGITHGRVYKHICHLLKIIALLGKDLDTAGEDDIRSVMTGIETSDYSPHTKKDYRITVKKFYKWLNNGECPSMVKWIRIDINHNDLLHILPHLKVWVS